MMFNTYKYKYLKLLLLVFGTIYANVGNAQHVYIPDSIIVKYVKDKGLVFDYVVEKGNTMYSISKAFNADLIDLYAFNEGLNSKPLAIGASIIVPFDIQALENIGGKNKRHIVYYRVGKKENLFRIAKMYFGIDVKVVRDLNKLKDNTIQPDQFLMIGKVNYNGILKSKKDSNISDGEKDKTEETKIIKDKEKKIEPKEKIIVKDSVVQKDVDTLKVRFDKIIVVKEDTITIKKDSLIFEDKPSVFVSDSGKAIWNKRSRTKGVFVLNNSAKINSMMEIYNPTVKRTIQAKVIGRIPPNSYPKDVKLILSPQAATSLGALNSRFFVKIKYNKK